MSRHVSLDPPSGRETRSPAAQRFASAIRRVAFRAIYACADSRLVVTMTAFGLAAATRLAGAHRAQGLLSAFERRFVYSGFPGHGFGWVNIHLSRFAWRVRRWRRHQPRVAVPPARSRTPIRMGCVGRFRGLLSFPPAFFEAFPRDAELHLFDLEYNGACAGYLAGVPGARYIPVAATPGHVDATARAINAADLDVLVNANAKQDAYELLDRIETPCVLHFCPGSDLLHHERVAANLNGQPQADYFFRGRQVFCGTTARPLGPERVLPIEGYYDPRDIPLDTYTPWGDRRPLIVFHGSLYKLAHDEVLDTLFSLVADDPTVAFVAMGKESPGALSRITERARRHGVAARVHYEGSFDPSRSRGGAVQDPGWRRLKDHLSQARLAPDPWPVGGASSRFEAFALGAPSVHLGVRMDPASWGRPQPSVVEVPHMLVPGGVAWSVAEYRAIAERCLHDEAYGSALAAAQHAVARTLGDPARLWHQIFDAYRDWLESIGAETGHVSLPHPAQATSSPAARMAG
ncbi:MAG: hypothetical protein ACT4QD_00150 [Acidobacteriota bacterium]